VTHVCRHCAGALFAPVAVMVAIATLSCPAVASAADGRVARSLWNAPARGTQIWLRRDRTAPSPAQRGSTESLPPLNAPTREARVDWRPFDEQQFAAAANSGVTRAVIEPDARLLRMPTEAYFVEAAPHIDAPSQLADSPSGDGFRPLSTAMPKRRASGPSGTMFLMSLEQFTEESQQQAARQRSGASAGVVLSRPPGEYSLDWFGVAISAPIH
jgi:hypothetical protein